MSSRCRPQTSSARVSAAVSYQYSYHTNRDHQDIRGVYVRAPPDQVARQEVHEQQVQGPDQQLPGQGIAVVQGRHQRCSQLLQHPALQRLLDDGQPLVCSSRTMIRIKKKFLKKNKNGL